MKTAAGIVLPAVIALLPLTVQAQEAETVYMGIDLAAQEAPEQQQPQTHSLGLEMREMLDEGVELGCLSFTAPASYAQTDNRSRRCQQYIGRLAAASAQGDEEEARHADADNPLRSVPLVELARAAQSGNKQAQLELGIRFEEGIGVQADWDNALELYTLAARHTPATSGIRVNAATDQSAFAGEGGTLGRRELSRRIPGLQEARERRDALEARMQAGESAS